jgi:hypothetical protein
MRATDLIRNVLDLIDQIDGGHSYKQSAPELLPTPNADGELVSRFRQIHQVLANRDTATQYSNTPNEIVTDVASVTTDVGGGPNGIKHPKDIRVKDPRGYE